MKYPVLLLFVLLLASVHGYWCYQETANVSTDCGGVNTGRYNASVQNGNNYFYINYTRHDNSSIGSKWMVKYGYPLTTENITIPAPCWNQTIQLRIYSTAVGWSVTYPQCYNYTSSSWATIGTIATDYFSTTCTLSDPLYVDKASYLYDGDWTTWSSLCKDGSSSSYRWVARQAIKNEIYEEAMYWYINMTNNIGLCSGTYNQTVLNLSLYHEDTIEPLNGSIAVDVTDGVVNLSFQNSSTHRIEICANNSVNLSYYGTIYHTSNNNLNKYFIYETFSGTQKQVTLYNFPYVVVAGYSNISTLEVELRDQYYNYYPDLIGQLYRYYPQNHSWIMVQMDKSDTFGKLYYDIEEQNVQYKIQFYSQSTYVDTTDSFHLSCTNNYCWIRKQIYPLSTTTESIRINYTYDNNTRMLYVNYTDPSLTMTYISMSLDKDTITGVTHICSETQYTTSGQVQCNATGYTKSAILKVTTSRSNPKYDIYEYINLGDTTLGGVVGVQETGLWVFGLGLTIAAVGLFSPVAVVMMFIASLWISYQAGFSNIITTGFLVIATCMGIIIFYKVKT